MRPAVAGLNGLEVTVKESRGLWKRIAILVILVLIVLPLFAIVFGVSWIVPVKQQMSLAEQKIEPTIQVVVRATPTATRPPAVAASDATPTSIPLSASTSGAASMNTPQPIPASTDNTHSGFLSPDNWQTWLVILPGIAGLVLLIGSVVVAFIVTNWKKSDPRSKDTNMNGDKTGKRTKLRYVLLVLLFWIALSVFLILDFVFTVSLYVRFVAIYAAFWVLVGALLLWGRPLREELLILALFVIVLFSVRFIDWHSRKPFLRDLYSIKEGMTPAQVDQIMGGYMKGHYGGPPGSHTQYEFDEQGDVVTGGVTYRHTNEGWGNSDWGTVTFENGRVVYTRFSPD